MRKVIDTLKGWWAALDASERETAWAAVVLCTAFLLGAIVGRCSA